MKRHILATAAIAVTWLGTSDADAAQRCGQLHARWNVPAGAAVVTRTEGIVASTFDAVGRYWSHIVVSDGQDGIYQSHRGTAEKNGYDGIIFDLPLNPALLRAGGPGPSHTNLQGAAASMGGITRTRLGNNAFNHALFFTGNTRSEDVLTFLRAHPRTAVDTGLERLQFSFIDTSGRSRFGAVPYSFLNFRSSQGSENGTVDPRGFACSNFLAYAAARATGQRILPESLTVDEGLRGLKAAHDATEAECHTGLEEWEAILSAPVNACGRAAEQLANCLAGVNGYGCDRRGSEWKTPANWFGGGGAISVLSPDRIVNWGAAAITGNTSPWAPNADGSAAFGREVSWSVDADDDGEAPLGCWGEAGDVSNDDPGHMTTLDSGQVAPTQDCADISVSLPSILVRAYDQPGGGDAEMGGNHPILSGTVRLRQQGDTLVADNTLSMRENGGDGSFFAHAGAPSRSFTRPVFVAPPHCRIAGITAPSGLTGTLSVPDAGDDNHAATLYAAGFASGALRAARCVSDTDGAEPDRLYCQYHLQPVTVQLRPRFIVVPITPIPLFPSVPPLP